MVTLDHYLLSNKVCKSTLRVMIERVKSAYLHPKPSLNFGIEVVGNAALVDSVHTHDFRVMHDVAMRSKK